MGRKRQSFSFNGLEITTSYSFSLESVVFTVRMFKSYTPEVILSRKLSIIDLQIICPQPVVCYTITSIVKHLDLLYRILSETKSFIQCDRHRGADLKDHADACICDRKDSREIASGSTN